MLAKARSSGLDDATVKALRLEAIDAKHMPALGKEFAPTGGVKIPYFDLDGRPTSFFRVRYLQNLPGFAGMIEKPQRYVQPAKTLNEVYLPPLLSSSWRTISTTEATRVAITEGEFKAARACMVGLPTIGLGGVDVWRSGKRGIQLLAALEEFKWNGRSVVIIFDSDALKNRNVCSAQCRLAHELANRGALPTIVALPEGSEGSKQGLDDYMLTHDLDDLEALIDDSPPWSEAVALWEMNDEVAYIKDPGIVLVRDTAQRLSPGDFKSHAYVHRTYMAPNAQGVSKRHSTAKSWLEWPSRFELSNITYRPGAEKIVDNQWNTWSGWGVEPKAGDIKPWSKLLDFIFAGAEDGARRYFEQWCAYPLQDPGSKLFSSVLVWGLAQGTGKSLIGYTLSSIYGRNSIEISDADLHSSFNEWAADKQFVMADEITGSDKRAEANRLKRLITQERMLINIKYIPTYTVPDCVNYYFTSNQPDAFFLEDADRRYFIHEVTGQPLAPSFYKEYDRWRRSTGPAHLFAHLLSVDTTGFDPRSPAFATASKVAMINDSKSDLASWCASLRDDPGSIVKPHYPRAVDCELFSASQLLHLYAPDGITRVTANGLGRELKRAGFRQVNGGVTVRTASGCMRLYAIRNVDKWVSVPHNDCAAHWNQYFGTKEDKF